MRQVPPVFDPQKLGVRFEPGAQLFTINVTPVEVLPSDQKRVSVLFQNLGATTITLNPLGEAASVQAIRLLANSDPLQFLWGDWGSIIGNPWSAVSNIAGGSLYVLFTAWNTS